MAWYVFFPVFLLLSPELERELREASTINSAFTKPVYEPSPWSGGNWRCRRKRNARQPWPRCGQSWPMYSIGRARRSRNGWSCCTREEKGQINAACPNPCTFAPFDPSGGSGSCFRERCSKGAGQNQVHLCTYL